MEIVSVHVGPAKEVTWRGDTVRTAIWKAPVEAARIGPLGLEGDQQADPAVHGGADKAVYAYSADHYDFWKAELPGKDLPYGVFGENLSVAGWDDASACLGDVYRAGEAELVAIQPRLPCSKLGVRFDDPGMVKRFAKSLRLGVYFRVAKPGAVRRLDAFEKLSEHPVRFPIYDFARLYFDAALSAEKARPALEHPLLNDNWRSMLTERLKKRRLPACGSWRSGRRSSACWRTRCARWSSSPL
ncbi:MAG: MOSC domain-containing protein [Elusimicrobiota bacterium]|nr:MAG: MOSC domain-containing protein [Elusimicrobiota bacterium]